MFEGDYCPNCDNYIKALETENAEVRKELQPLWELVEHAAVNVVSTDPMKLGTKWDSWLRDYRALKQRVDGGN